MSIGVEGFMAQEIVARLAETGDVSGAPIILSVNGRIVAAGEVSHYRFTDAGIEFAIRPPPALVPGPRIPRQDDGK